MEYKIYLYIIFTFIAAIGVSGINTNGFIKKNKRLEAVVLLISFSFVIGYVLTNFFIDFVGI